MKTLILILLMLLTATPSTAAEPPDDNAWTTTDWSFLAAYTTMLSMDWAQTLHISRNPDKYFETNSFLGQHPSEGRVNAYFAGILVINTAIATLLPKSYRRPWYAFWIGYETAYVQNNRKIGIGISLRF